MTPEGVNVAHPDKLYIAGRWVPAHSGRMIDLISPNTEQVAGRVAEADEADMDAAVAAARDAFDNGPWPTTPPAERIAAFRRMVAHLETRVPELARAWTAQMGGLPRSQARCTVARSWPWARLRALPNSSNSSSAAPAWPQTPR